MPDDSPKYYMSNGEMLRVTGIEWTMSGKMITRLIGPRGAEYLASEEDVDRMVDVSVKERAKQKALDVFHTLRNLDAEGNEVEGREFALAMSTGRLAAMEAIGNL